MKVPIRWLTSCPVDIGKLSLHKNWDLLSPRTIHLYSSVFLKSITRNSNSTDAMMYPCLKPTLKSLDVSILTMMSLTATFSYTCLIPEHSLGGAPYLPSMEISSAWLEVYKELTRSINATYVGNVRFRVRFY